MRSFSFLKKKEEVVVEEKKKTKSPFDMAFKILRMVKMIESHDNIEMELDKIFEEFQDLGELSFVANVLLKYSIYNKKCLAKNADMVMVFNSLSPVQFIKYFVTFCFENEVRFSDFLKYYNCGLMSSSQRYKKHFEDQLAEHDAEELKLILQDNDLSSRDLYFLIRDGHLKVGEGIDD